MVKHINIGLYTTKPNINVGEIASMFLNGGRTCAVLPDGETKNFIFHQLLHDF
jgi:hypothetical protein